MCFGKPLFLLLVSLPLLFSCAGRDHSRYLDPDRLDAEVQDILTSRGLGRRQALLAIRDYEAFLSAYFKTKSDLKAEAMHRLGDLFMEVTHNANRKAQQIHEERMKLYREGQLKEKPIAPRFDYSKPIELYERILKLYPTRESNDRVLYQLAHAYLEEGRTEATLKILKTLSVQYPRSPYVLEAIFRIGDLYFEMGLFAEAAQAYESVIGKGESPFLQKALYKLGWSYLKLRQYDRTVETFLRLLDEKSMVREDIQERVLAVDTFTDLDWDLVHEVVRVMAISFDHLGGGSALTRFFERVGHRGYEEMLCRGLGDFYLAGGKTQEAVNVYTLFLDRYPLHPQAPMLQMSIVRAYDQNREFSRATEARIRLIKDFGEGSRWAERYPREAEGVLHIRLKETTYQLALYFHSEAQRLKRPDEYEKAVGWYRRFLKSYPGAQEAPEVHFMLAEGLYELGRYREAAEAYEAVAYGYPQHSRSGEAGYAALVAYEKWGMNSPQVQKEVQASLIESGKRFVKAFPTGPKVPDVLLKIASLEFREGRREEARSLAERLLSQTGEVPGEMKTEAYQMLAKGYLVGGEYSKAAEALRSALALLLPNQGRERLELQNLLASSLYKEAERVTAAGRPEEAAGLFVHIAEEVPGSPISQAALYDAAILMLDQGKRGTAQTLLERLIASSSPFRSKAQRQLALLYEEEGKYFEAAQLYDRLWEEMEEGPEKADTLFQSAVLFEKSQRWKEAADRFQQFTERFPKEGQGGIEATFRAAQSLFRLGDAAGAEALYSSVIVRYDQGDLSRERTGHFAAKAYLMLGRFRHERFSRILLRAPLEESLRRKEEIMEEASVHYRQAASLKQAEVITEVSYRMGDLFEEFGKALVESERPSELTAGELREYDHLLEQQAQPWREKAVAAYESNVHRTQAVGLYDEWVKKSYGRLARLLPQYYGREELGEVVAREPRF